MRDLIDERNAREKIKSSIIKRANVHYMTPEELARIKEEEDKKKAQEIYERLQAEAKEDEEKKAEERRQAMEQRQKEEQGYNETTNSPSGAYGTKAVVDVTREQINAILSEKQVTLEHVIEEVKHEEE